MRQLFPAASEDCLDLLAGLLRFNPATRLSAKEALSHPYFAAPPVATLPPKVRKEAFATLKRVVYICDFFW